MDDEQNSLQSIDVEPGLLQSATYGDPLSPGASSIASSAASSSKRKRKAEDVDLEMISLLKENQKQINRPLSEKELFGQTVARSLDHLPEFKQEIAKIQINNILFQIRFDTTAPINPNIQASTSSYQLL